MSDQALELNFMEVKQNVGTFYSCVIDAQALLSICKFDFRQIHDNGGVKEFLGIQRPLNEERVRQIRKYIQTEDASFPTSIVISVNEKCAEMIEIGGTSKLRLRPFISSDDNEKSVSFDSIAKIIDGQHRLKAFEGMSENWSLSVNIFVGVDEGTQAMIFSKVNLAQTKVNKSLVYDLFSLDKGRSPEKTCHEIVVNLNDIPTSPFFKSIKRLGSATDGVFGETLSQATIVKGILPYFSTDPMGDRDLGRRLDAFPDRGAKDFNRRVFYPFFKNREDHKALATILNYYSAVKTRWPDAWAFNGRGAVLSRTNGFNGTIRFLRDAYLHLTNTPQIPSQNDFLEILNRSTLSSSDFSTDRFPPGSSGSAALYNELIKTLV